MLLEPSTEVDVARGSFMEYDELHEHSRNVYGTFGEQVSAELFVEFFDDCSRKTSRVFQRKRRRSSVNISMKVSWNIFVGLHGRFCGNAHEHVRERCSWAFPRTGS